VIEVIPSIFVGVDPYCSNDESS
jgi:hypothetical protein